MKEKHPITLVIFGATGDLAQRKILPALLDLYCKDFLPDNFKVVGFSRKDLSDENYREFFLNSITNNGRTYPQNKIDEFLVKIHYKQGDLNSLESYEALSNYLKDIDKNIGDCSNKLFYLAVPPNLYESIFKNISESGLGSPCREHNDERWSRILVEKPFGSDRENAIKLDKMLGKLFQENQIFRIDHYLAKETIRNIMTFRFANAIFEPIWNKDFVQRVEINLFEKEDIDNRINFYDGIGALRDVGQNHLLQMLALVAMEDPGSLKADDIRKARGQVFADLDVSKKDLAEFRRAQYIGYSNNSIFKDSKTETYFKIKVGVKNSRWKGVPFYLESGKALNESKTEIKIIFKDKQSSVCLLDGICHYNNTLTINIHPEQKISICFWTKKPGLSFDLEQKELSFNFSDGENSLSDAYEKVFYDCIKGDQTLFNSTYETSTQWGIIADILKLWENLPLLKYQKGSDPKDIK